jgi:hypothetical protein
MENVDIMRLMLAHYRAVFRDAQSHGFEAARWSSGVILTMLERGELTWDNTLKMADERWYLLMFLIRMHRVFLIIEITEDRVKVKVTVLDTIILIHQTLTEGDPIESWLNLVCSLIMGLALMILITRTQKHDGAMFAGTVGMLGTFQGLPLKRI